MRLLPELEEEAVPVTQALKAEAKVAKIYRLFAAMRHGDDL